jgi:hypothetical protein
MTRPLTHTAHNRNHSIETIMAEEINTHRRHFCGPLRQIHAGDLNVGYVEIGPSEGRAVILLHGWPYDIHSFAEVAPALGAKGYCVIIPPQEAPQAFIDAIVDVDGYR